METEKEKIARLVDQAKKFEETGDLEKSLESYSAALDALVGCAKNYAETSGPAVIEAVTGSGAVLEQYLSKFDEYLKKDKTAAVISNNMGLVFAKMGNKASAKVFFEQAIDLTPKGDNYDNPHIGMEMAEKLP